MAINFLGSIAPVSRATREREKEEVLGNTFDSLTARYAPKLKTIRDIALSVDLDSYPELRGSAGNFRFRKQWVYFGDIPPQLFDFEEYQPKKISWPDRINPNGYPGFVSAALTTSKRIVNGKSRNDFVVINLAERCAMHKGEESFARKLKSQMDAIITMLDTPISGTVNRDQIDALRMFLYGNAQVHQNQGLKFNRKNVLENGATTSAAAHLSENGWPLKFYHQQEPACASVLPLKVKKFGEFLHDAKIVAMTMNGKAADRYAYPVPITPAVIFLSANVSSMLKGPPLDTLLKIINHDLNCTGMLVRVIFGDKKMGSVGLSLRHIGTSILTSVPSSVTEMDQPGRRGNRMCSWQGMPTLPTEKSLKEVPLRQWVVRLIVLAAPDSEHQKFVKLKHQQDTLKNVIDEINAMSSRLRGFNKMITRDLPVDADVLCEMVRTGHTRLKETDQLRAAQDLKIRYKTSKKDEAIGILHQMLNAAAENPESATRQAFAGDYRFIKRWIALVQTTDNEAFGALVDFALRGALTSHSNVRGRYDEKTDVEKRVNQALTAMLKNGKIMEVTSKTLPSFEAKGNNKAISNNMNNDTGNASAKYVMLPKMSWSFLILKIFGKNVTPIENAFTKETIFKGSVIYTAPNGTKLSGLKLGKIVNGKAELTDSSGNPVPNKSGKTIMVAPSQVVSTNEMNLNTGYAARSANFERARNKLDRDWLSGKSGNWSAANWKFINEVMRNSRFTNRLRNKEYTAAKLRQMFLQILIAVREKYNKAPPGTSEYNKVSKYLNKEDRDFLRLFVKMNSGNKGFNVPEEQRKALNNLRERDAATPTRRRTRWNAEKGEIRYTPGRPNFPAT